MSTFISELKDLVLYNKDFYAPIREDDKFLGSCIFLLTPNLKSSKKLMTYPKMINRRYFESYYIEKDITFFINQENALIKKYENLIHESVNLISESKLTSEERKALKDSDFGLPKTRQYPIHDKGHVHSAIRYFGSCPEDQRDELAKNIKKKADKFNIKINDNSLVHSYLETFYTEDVGIDNNAMVYKLDEWKSGKSNILFIAGYAGSGKTSLARELANEYNVEHVQLDSYCRDKLQDINNVSTETKIKILLANLKNDYGNKRCIVEGVHILSLIADDEGVAFIKQNSLIVLNTSLMTSTYRAIKRDIDLFDKYVTKYNLNTVGAKFNFIFNKIFINYPKLNGKLAYRSCMMNIDELKSKLMSKVSSLMTEFAEICNSMTDIEKFYIGEDYIQLTSDGKTIQKYPDDVNVIYRKIYKENGNNVGFLDLYQNSYDKELKRAYVVIGVKEEYRGKGYARKMMNEMMNTVSNSDLICINYNAYIENIASNELAKSYGMEYSHTYEYNESYKNEYKLYIKDYNVIKEEYDAILEETIDDYKATYTSNDYELTESYMRVKTQDSDCIIYFNELFDETVFNESDSAYNNRLRSMLYNERIKNNKEAILIYDGIKADVPIIKRTFIDYKFYKKRNLFIDWSYYTETFFKNNIYKADKGVDLYFDFVSRFLEDKRLELNGYTKKTVFVPIMDWLPSDDTDSWDHTKNLNPISCIYRLLKLNPDKLKSWGQYDFVFIGESNYFKVNFNTFDKSNIGKFITLIKNTLAKTPIAFDGQATAKAITADVVKRIEDNTSIKIHNLTGGTKALTPDDVKEKVNKAEILSSDEKKAALVSVIQKTAEKSSNADEVIDKLDKDDTIDIAQLLSDLEAEEKNKIDITKSRASRIIENNNKILDKSISGRKIKDILAESNKAGKELETYKVPIESINEGWNSVSFTNFQKLYDLDADIVKILMSFSEKSVPVSVLDIAKEDTSTSEDFVYTYTVKCEDAYGQRFTLKFDIPKFKNNRFMRLGGNDKTINGQLVLLPIIKTDLDTCQIVSNYNKIFIGRYGTASGKSLVIADRILKTLNKLSESKNSKYIITKGDNSKICEKYELPIDFIDISSEISSIEYSDSKKFKIFFNIDECIKELDLKKIKYDKNHLNFGYCNDKVLSFDGNTNTFSLLLKQLLSGLDKEFLETYDTTTVSSRYTYSKASILNTEIPIAVIMGYNEGLQRSLEKAKIDFEISDSRVKYDKDIKDAIKFKDGYIIYNINYNSSLFMNGLKECNTESYSLKEMNSKSMWLDFLDIFTNRIKADGLDNFYDLMVDPITEEVCIDMKLPTKYPDLLAYANMLLADNKYNRHTDITGNRLRTNEIVAGYTYKVLADAYGDYKNQLKRGKKGATMSIKQSAVIDALLLDPTSSDFSFLNPLNEIESANAVSFKGLSGMNSDRSYSLDKRTFDDTMINVVSMSTGFAGNVGITRQATIDANVVGKRGYIKTSTNDKMNTTKSLSMTEALTPMGSTHDDTFRSAMTFIQFSKHMMRTNKACPNLITNGADEALPYLTSDTFAFKAKDNGKVLEKTDSHIILGYKDGTKDYIDIRKNIKKNSDGGFYITVQLESKLKKGDSFKKDDILAYDPLSYSRAIGDHTNNNISFNSGTLAKIAIMNTDEGFEDSAIISNWLAEAMTSDIVVKKDKYFPKNTNIYQMVKKGQEIQEGDPLVIFQNAFEDEDVNLLLKNVTSDNKDDINELG